MKYYYLDENRRIQGPFDVQQMAALYLSGAIKDSTLCAAAGQKSWSALSEQPWIKDASVTMPAAENAAPVFGKLGNCACCGAEQEGYMLPPSCPSCGAAQAPVNNSLWSFFCLALRRLFSLRGRTQRKEYWSFVLFSGILLLIIHLLAVLLMLMFGSYDFFSFFIDYLIVSSVLSGIVSIFSYPLLVRRLHDIGLSGKWVFIPLVFAVYGWVSIICSYSQMQKPEVKHEAETISRVMSPEEFRSRYPGAELPDNTVKVYYKSKYTKRTTVQNLDELEAFSKAMNSPFGTSKGMQLLARLLMLSSQLVSILVLIAACIDSKRGANKYGPSYKYPHSES